MDALTCIPVKPVDNEAWLPCHEACRPFSRVTEVKFVIHFIIVYEFTIPILN